MFTTLLKQQSDRLYGTDDDKCQSGISVDNRENEAQFAHEFDNGFHPAGAPNWGGMKRVAGAGYTPTHPAGELCSHNSPRVIQFPLAVPHTPALRDRIRDRAALIGQTRPAPFFPNGFGL